MTVLARSTLPVEDAWVEVPAQAGQSGADVEQLVAQRGRLRFGQGVPGTRWTALEAFLQHDSAMAARHVETDADVVASLALVVPFDWPV